MKEPEEMSTPRKNRTIVAPFDQGNYPEIVNDSKKFRGNLDTYIERFPELFPHEISVGYELKEIKHSKKLSITIRRIVVNKITYTIRPCMSL